MSRYKLLSLWKLSTGWMASVRSSLPYQKKHSFSSLMGLKHALNWTSTVSMSGNTPATFRCFSSGSLSHVDTEGNTASTTFDFTDENYEKIETILKKYPKNYKSSAVIALLDLAQRQCGGWIPLAAMNQVAKILEMPPIRVYEIVTFYSMFYREPIGKYNVQVCCTTPCMLRGAYDILEAIKKHFDLELGGTSKDGMFHLEEVECLGACVNAPMMQVNDDYYEDLTVESAIRVLEDLRDNKTPKIGPQNNRHQCVGIQGKTTLLSEPQGPYCRPLEEGSHS